MVRIIQPQTERLRLRQWRDEDSAPFAALNADPRVMEYFPGTLDRAASDAAMRRNRTHIAERGWGFWAVERKEGGEFIGFVGIKQAPEVLPFAPCVEIGWRLAAEFWGCGYASEAARASLEVAFEILRLSEIVSFTALQNYRSQRVMQRLGMCAEPHAFDHPLLPESSPLRRHCLYRLSAAQWRCNSEPG
ncbi:GNAT family N-acetyltransferase [Microbulbifer thermotolerans]|uniref:GCN5 family acetyltransferase n=1 Tax=Microbulbifer thermotolerans TaxID=252514 RepID=A0A143HIK7_MICTH|nr:GNAT family N-acetyltransferase [Microbulbifer thermotolerans]AMX01310.1 GCN5 family acetyltransferase [Microbulbifer thermotolerans]MCX2840346.1 GNAT family N-acetyltransferase [Microbulbifer thermotolerans]WKT60771.1 GNAT family N-acetyltransferase [Microbulbifer thermotolerans]